MQMKKLLLVVILALCPTLALAQSEELVDWNKGQLLYLRHHEFQRPWAYEIEVAVFNPAEPVGKGDPDEDRGYRHIKGVILSFPKKPVTEQEVTDKLNAALTRVYAELSEPPPPEPEKVYTESEVVQILVEKKYLEEGQALTDLATKEEAEVVK